MTWFALSLAAKSTPFFAPNTGTFILGSDAAAAWLSVDAPSPEAVPIDVTGVSVCAWRTPGGVAAAAPSETSIARMCARAAACGRSALSARTLGLVRAVPQVERLRSRPAQLTRTQDQR